METQIVKGTVYLMAGQFIFLLSGYGIHMGLARLLGPQGYGLFGVIISILVWVEVSVGSGIPSAVKKFIPEDDNLAYTISFKALRIQLLYGGFIFLTLFMIAPLVAVLFHDKSLTIYIRLASIDIPFFALYSTYLSTLNGLRAFGKQAIATIIYSISKLSAIFLLVFLGLSLTGALIGNVVASIVGLIIAKSLSTIPKNYRTFSSYKIIKFGIPILLFALAYNLLLSIDLWCIKVLLKDNLETGFYTAASTLARIPYFVFLALTFTLLPSISKSISNYNREITNQYISEYFRILLILLLPIAFIIAATSEILVSLVYSPVYSPAASALTILIFGLVFFSLIMTSISIILANNEPWVSASIAALLIPVDFVLNLKFIPLYGIRGAAIGTTITALIGLTITSIFVVMRFGTLMRLRSFINIVFASLIIYFLAWAYSASGILLIFNYIVLFIIYLGILFALKEIGKTDLERLKSIFTKP